MPFQKLWQNLQTKLSEVKEDIQKEVLHQNPNIIRKVKQKKDDRIKITLDVPVATQLRILAITVLFYGLVTALGQLQNLLVTLLIVLFLALGLTPFVQNMEKNWRLPRAAAIFVIYFIFLGILAVFFFTIVPVLVEQITVLSQGLSNIAVSPPDWMNTTAEYLNFDLTQVKQSVQENIAGLTKSISNFAGSAAGVVTGVLGMITNLMYGLVLLFFVLMEKELIGTFLLRAFPPHERENVKETTLHVQKKFAAWFKGQLILMLSVGVAMFIGMKAFEIIFGMPYAFSLAIVAGIMELFPYIGVFITGVMALLISASYGLVAVLAVLGWMFLLQFLEGNILVPYVMKQATGMPSVVVLISFTAAGLLGNALGGVSLAILLMILAIPVVASVSIYITEYFHLEEPPIKSTGK